MLFVWGGTDIDLIYDIRNMSGIEGARLTAARVHYAAEGEPEAATRKPGVT